MYKVTKVKNLLKFDYPPLKGGGFLSYIKLKKQFYTFFVYRIGLHYN